MYQVEFTDKAKKDWQALDNSQRKDIQKSITRIEQLGMQAGQPLSGSLAGCRKLKHKKLGLRVIFRQTDRGIEIIEVIAIGKREDSKIYHTAEQRIKNQGDTNSTINPRH